MTERKIKSLLIGTFYDNRNYYVESIDLEKNIKKNLITEFLAEEKNKINLQEDINNIGFCLTCINNVTSKSLSICKDHSIIYFSDLIKSINIEEIENNLNNIIDSYNEIIKAIEERIKNFKQRNDNQIIFAKKIIDIYKNCLKSNNLTYQTFLNTKNILNFNEINKDNFINVKKPIDFEFNILKAFSIDNYLGKEILFEKVQKNAEFSLNDKKEKIKSFIFLEKDKKIIFNSKKKIYLLNPNNFSIINQIKTDRPIIKLNLMNDKKSILLSFPDSIEKIIIKHNKIILEKFLDDDIFVGIPGIIINYNDEFAWTYYKHIGFSKSKYYNVNNQFNLHEDNFSGGYYEFQIYNLFQYKNNILFILLFVDYDLEGNKSISMKLGSYPYIGEPLKLDFCYCQSYNSNCNIYDFRNNEIIVFGVGNIYIIDINKWEIIKLINLSKNVITYNTYLLEEFTFLILFSVYDDNYNFIKLIENDILIMSINENSHQNIILKKINSNSFYNNIIYTPIKINASNYNSHIISFDNNKISFFELINFKSRTFLNLTSK